MSHLSCLVLFQMTEYQDLNGDRQRFYSGHVMKLNRHRHGDPRIVVLCDKHLYLLRTNLHSSKKRPMELEQIVGLSISPGNDHTLVIHCKVRALERSTCIAFAGLNPGIVLFLNTNINVLG